MEADISWKQKRWNLEGTNSNISCIEINGIQGIQTELCKTNSNISCIEILVRIKPVFILNGTNSNISCIEIIRRVFLL